MGTRGSFLGVSGRDVKSTTRLHLVLRSRMCGAISPSPNMPSWHGVQLKHRDYFAFAFTFTHM